MITSREVANAANQWLLRHDVVEKDYVLGWLLAAISNHPVTNRWAFKGGTCLRKCWFETYRFSEDLDFTVPAEDLEISRLAEVFGEIAEWLVAIQLGASAGGSHGPVVNSSRSALSLSMPHLFAVSR